MELVMFVGIPASGKSTESAKYREKGYLVLSSDEIRAALTGGRPVEEFPDSEMRRIHSQVFETIRKRTANALRQGQSVLVDATNLSRKRRISFLEQFRSFSCPKKCVLFIAPPELCMARNRKRTGAALVPESGMYKMLCNFECPNYWEGWDEIVPVADVLPYSFPFDAIRGFAQENPHHNLTLDRHMEETARFCREQGYGPMLERVARFHDIGKLYTKRFCNAMGKPTEHAHYLGHENYSAYLYLCENLCGKTLSAEAFRQLLYEASLINCHMRPLVHWRNSENKREKDLRRFGEAFIADLIALHQADRSAHQEEV